MIRVIDQKIVTNRRNAMLQCPQPTAIPAVFVNATAPEQQCKSVDLVNHIETMQIDHDDAEEDEQSNDVPMSCNQLKLQWKFRQFAEDYRPNFFGVNKYERMHATVQGVDIRKLCRKPFDKRLKNINYDGDDSGVEWYDDIDDLEHMDDDDEDDEEGINLREDGFENDKFLIDDDDEEAIGDREAMKNLKKHQKLQDELKGEYPIQHNRERGDEFDEPFVVRLPSMKRMKAENGVLYALTLKKSSVFVQELSHISHDDEKENDLKYLIANETKNDAKNEREKEEKKQRKKDKKAEKKRKRKLEKKEKKEREAMDKSKSDKMECDADDDEDEDEDDDIKMTNDENDKKKIKTPIKNRLTSYFKVATKRKMDGDHNKNVSDMKVEEDDKSNHNKKEEEVITEPKKKKRRIVMCELIE